MTAGAESEAPSVTSSRNAGVKKGLPSAGLAQAEASAEKLWEVARRGMTAKQVFGNNIGMRSITASSFRTRIALLRGFGLVKVDDAQVGLSELGLQLVQSFDEEAKRAARRKAVMSLKAYRDVVETFDSTELPSKEKLAGKLQFEYGKTADFANQAAESLIDSLKFADMLDSHNVVRKNGAVAHAVTSGDPSIVPPVDRIDDDEDLDDADQAAAELDEAFEDEEAAAEDVSKSVGDDTADTLSHQSFPAQSAAAGTAVSLAITLDLSGFRADDVVQILSALGLTKRG